MRVDLARQGTIQASGTSLYYETRGNGPAVLCIHGGAQDAGELGPVAGALADEFTVVTYDGRGRSRSPRPPGKPSTSVQEQADDAAALLETLGVGPAAVFGTSSGATVLLDMVVRHPASVRRALVHEPPIIGVLPSAAEVGGQLRALIDRGYAQGGPRAALELFMRTIGGDSTYEAFAASDPEQLERVLGNADWFFEVEMPAFMRYVPDAQALAKSSVPIVPLAGAESRDTFLYETTRWVAKQVGVEVTELSGGHAGFVEHPAEVGAILRPLLR